MTTVPADCYTTGQLPGKSIVIGWFPGNVAFYTLSGTSNSLGWDTASISGVTAFATSEGFMDEFNEAQPTSVPKTKKRKSVTPKSMTRRIVLSFPHAPGRRYF
jgi:hypothetical protein